MSKPVWVASPTPEQPDRMILNRSVADRLTGGTRVSERPVRTPLLMSQVDRDGSNLLRSFS